MPLEITRLAGALGAEVRGIDLARATASDADRIRALLLEHGVLFFPAQNLTVEQHVAFGRHFGPLEAHPHLKNPYTQHPELFELAATHGGIADEWHTDLTFLPSPSQLSILRMVKCPAVGGDTMWTSLCAAYDALSAPLRELCDGLTALHNAEPHGQPDKMTVHPVVRVHPDTGRRALYVNEHFTRRIVELSAPESAALLGFLTSWVQQERFVVRYRWSEGTIGMWDNRVTQHCVVTDFVGERVIQRVTIMGDQVKGNEPRWPAWKPSLRSAQTRHDRVLLRWYEQQRGAKGE
ncbi:MAG: TauD/TfdA family dioxygenase [Deltaproteobacteria bacterium]|nr:TauD/TfdA family dioxygenase [Deltaproteobacteria bacterium]